MTTILSLAKLKLSHTNNYNDILDLIPFKGGKWANIPLKNIPVDYFNWILDNNPNMMEWINYPECKVLVLSLIRGSPLVFKDNLKPKCKCKSYCKSVFSKKNQRYFWTCDIRHYDRDSEEYFGGCDFFKWGFLKYYKCE